jgi:predicted dehydrogenase
MKKVAVVGNNVFDNYIFSGANEIEVAKIYLDENESDIIARNRFPAAELVHDVEELVKDTTIKMVLVSKPKVHHAGSLLKAGKLVRVI